MRTAFPKHALLAGLLAASLGTLTAPVALAFAETGDPVAASGAAEASGSTSGGSAPTPIPSGKLTLATWFGPGFYGHATACGQKMSPTLVGVASRTLPCGTLVQIGYRGRRLTLPVLDRGPYGHNGATWDLTSGAARALKIGETVRITAQVVGRVPNTPALGEAPAAAPPTSSPAGPLAAPPAATGGASAG